MILRRNLILVVVATFAALRLLPILMLPAGQDEEWYGVPGLTIASEGIPRVPYVRTTDEQSVMLGAETMLFAQPPLAFYAQAPFYWLFTDTCGTARLASLIAACISIVTVYALGCKWFVDYRLGLLAAGLFSLSRLLYFPASSSRPDMLCGMWGLIGIYGLVGYSQTKLSRWLVATGICIGLAGLTHPFALVFATQATVWIWLSEGKTIERFRRFILFSLSVTVSFSLWLPLIFLHPDLFRLQFVANILRPAGPGLLRRFLIPFESIADQIPQLIDRAHPIQLSLMVTGVVTAALLAYRRKERFALVCSVLAMSGAYLLIVYVGVHPMQGFWCYFAGPAWLCFSYSFILLFRYVDRRFKSGKVRFFIKSGLISLLVLAFIPGGGLRTVYVLLLHRSDWKYSSPRFIHTVLSDIPANATITVGPEYAIEAYACGRLVTLACDNPLYFLSTDYPTDYYIFSRRSLPKNHVPGAVPMKYSCEYLRSYGELNDTFANYAEVYRRVKSE